MSYDIIAKSILREHPVPHDYLVDIVEKDDMPGCAFLRLYADDINNKPDHYADALADWLNIVLNKLNQWTTAKWTWEMAEKPK
jgi:hypothetical protein